ncbi:hypothetical protein KXD93_21225 [Mucilaginibacter sp. BJC16-A38]|uniref:hypothetical protein n=1 Tax=Mucilaginibacter phenanthrenivorans TaxID=1234842 RepID=UPI002157D224|nr:hypothetical protein [Mucilaginibacter phenanthrenivorans]MCR8560188.1 hypothetical protein [Mucilaginibacter phenanthrenivorans]
MTIDRAIVATDHNPIYYEFWPLVAKGWKNIGIEPTAAVIGELNLNYAFGSVIKFPQIAGLPSGFIAQVIRFIIPCFFPEQVSVTGDMDMIPLNRNYFQQQISSCSNDSIVIYSADAYKNEIRYPMCYIAAKGKYFQQIIGLRDLELQTIIAFITDLFALNKNWDTDELYFAEQLHKSSLFKETVFLDRGGWKPFAKNRIDRAGWRYAKMGLITERYIDAHCLRPLHENMKELKDIADYLEQGSVGKKYLLHLLKQPVKSAYDAIRLLNQNHFRKDLYAIAGRLPAGGSSNKIIAFSLYGDDPRYTSRLEEVIQSYHKWYPGWVCRIYAAKDVRPEVVRSLSESGNEVIMMDSMGVNASYTQWRFLAIEDRDAEAVVIRDLDSFATQREKIMVDQWLDSGKGFHIIRDHVNHHTRIMAGMWGIRRNQINIRKETRKLFITDAYGIDQIFLERMIFPLIKNDVLVHDSYPRYPDESPLVIPLMPGEDYVGEVHTDNTAKERDRQYLQAHLINNFTIK